MEFECKIIFRKHKSDLNTGTIELTLQLTGGRAQLTHCSKQDDEHS